MTTCTCNPLHLEVGGFDQMCQEHSTKEVLRVPLSIVSAEVVLTTVDGTKLTCHKLEFAKPSDVSIVTVNDAFNTNDEVNFIDLRGRFFPDNQGRLYTVEEPTEPSIAREDLLPSGWADPRDWS